VQPLQPGAILEFRIPFVNRFRLQNRPNIPGLNPPRSPSIEIVTGLFENSRPGKIPSARIFKP
jgi:hypothetical protein